MTERLGRSQIADDETDWLTTGEASALTDPPISGSTLVRWHNEGKLRAIKTLGGHRRFARRDIESLMRDAS